MKNIKLENPQFAVAMETKNSHSVLSEKEILAQFSKKEQKEIKYKQRVLSSLAYFIGKDFEIPVELNKPGAGWHWDFKANKIRIDPKDLLEKPLDHLRFVISHEGGHRRISRADFIPLEEWRRPGFSFMMNAIEDPRDNNFVAENYPKFKEQMEMAYNLDLDLENKYKNKAQEKLGYQPRFMQAGFEYIKLWFKEQKGEKEEISRDLPDEVQEVVGKTITSAKDSWWRYPSRQEANESEETIRKYAQVSYEINRDEIWPEFQKLVEKDLEDQRTQEFMKDMQKGEGEGEQDQPMPQELKDNLTPEEQKELEDAIDKAIEEAKKESASAKAAANKKEKQEDKKAEGKEGEEKKGEPQAGEKTEGEPQEGEPKGKPIDLDSLSEELKQKIKEYIDSLPDDKKKELQDKAEIEIKGLEKEINEELEGKLSDNPEKSASTEASADKKAERGDNSKTTMSGGEPVRKGKLRKEPLDLEGIRIYKERLFREINKNENVYEEYRQEVLPIIEKLEIELRELFLDRRATRWQSGFRTGKRIDIKTRIQEKAKGVSVVESKAWQKREMPKEKDYAVSLLVDLSGSMRKDKKIEETFKAAIVLAEVLNRIGINVEILGFNDEIYEYQKFGEPISKEIREYMGGMFKEVEDSCCKACGNEHNETDLGWATKTASERLAVQKEENKFLITLTDGKLQESTKHPSSQYEAGKIIRESIEKGGVKLVGLGVGKGTGNVDTLYPNSLADIDVKEMAEKLAGVIKEMIVNYQNF
jgi:cobalamin biosynthesis protein CobT/predicted SprT family Zn-dependent metalloprotease